MDDGAGEGKFLEHASGKSGSQPLPEGGKLRKGKEFFDPVTCGMHPLKIGKELQVFLNRQFPIDTGLLREIPDLLFQVKVRSFPGLPQNAHPSPIGFQNPGKNLQQGCLTRPIGPYKRHMGPLGDGKENSPQSWE
jgi:hypothetical protein